MAPSRSAVEIEEAARAAFAKMPASIDGLDTGPFTYFFAGYRANEPPLPSKEE